MTAPTPGAMTPRLRRLLLVFLAVSAVAFVALSVRAVLRIPEIWQGDFISYYEGARRLVAGEPLYAAAQLAGPYYLGGAAFGVGFVYPPPAALVAVPLVPLGREVAFVLFVAASAVGMAWTAFAIARREGLSQLAAAVTAALVMLSAPTIEGLATGQANPLVAVLLGLTWLYPRASGYLAVVGGLVKVFPAAGLAWAIRERAPVLRPLLLGIVVVAVSVLVLGVGAWRDFVVSYANGMPTSFVFPEPPRHYLEPLLGARWAQVIVYGATGLLLVAVVRLRSAHAAFAALGIAMILPAPDWYMHYLVIPVFGVLPWLCRTVATFRRG